MLLDSEERAMPSGASGDLEPIGRGHEGAKAN
jgi:hypothetical protein